MKTRIIISNWKPIDIFGKNSLGKPQVQITQCIHYMHILWGINIKWIINILEDAMLDYFCIKNGFCWYKNSLSIIFHIVQNYLVESILDQGWEALIFFFFGGPNLIVGCFRCTHGLCFFSPAVFILLKIMLHPIPWPPTRFLMHLCLHLIHLSRPIL